MFDYSTHSRAMAVCFTNHTILLFSTCLAAAIWKENLHYCKGINSSPSLLRAPSHKWAEDKWSSELVPTNQRVENICTAVLFWSFVHRTSSCAILGLLMMGKSSLVAGWIFRLGTPFGCCALLVNVRLLVIIWSMHFPKKTFKMQN